MVGATALWTEISTSIKEDCGVRSSKVMARLGQLTEAHRLIGVSTPQEVKHQDGFCGTWDREVQSRVDKISETHHRGHDGGCWD
jgi:hypothetical protein